MTWDQLAISIASLVGTTAITSFLTDRIQLHLDYRKLKAKLDNFAGLQAVVLYDDNKYRIQSIDRHGIVLQNELQTLFIPLKKALDNIIALPSDHYETNRGRHNPETSAQQDVQVTQMMDEMIEQRFSALLARVKQDFVSEFMPQDEEFEEDEVQPPLPAKIPHSAQGVAKRPASPTDNAQLSRRNPARTKPLTGRWPTDKTK
jgi:hypothetical protein